MVYAALNKMLISGLRAREEILCDPAAKIVAVSMRKQFVQKYLRLRVHRERRLTRQDPMSRVIVWHRREPGDSQPLNQRFINSKEKCLVLSQPTSQCAAELVALERRYGAGFAIEVVLRIKRGVPQKLKRRAMKIVGAGASHRIDHSAGCLAELGGIGIGQHLEFKHSLDAQQHASRGAGSFVVSVINIGTIE